MLKTILILSIGILTCYGQENALKPNVIMILVDDLGWTDTTCYGSDLYQTPNVDELSRTGMRFTDAYSACTVCSPTRSSIMTGKNPANNNLTDWITGHVKPYAKLKSPNWKMHLTAEEITLAEAFKATGYKTVHIGKWHLGEESVSWPENQGFDENIAGFRAGSPSAHGGGGYFSPYNNPRLKDGPKGEYLTERLAQEASQYIQSTAKLKKPFFMNLWLYNVHTPLQARQEKIDKYTRLIQKGSQHTNPVYAAMVEHMDDAVGTVMQAVKDAGIEDNTIIIFNSDNGGLRGNYENNRQKVTSNYPLRSGKGDMYEGGVRVPMIIKWSRKIKAGQTSSSPIISHDIYPTLLDLCKIDVSKKQDIDGISLVPELLEGKTIQRDALYWHYPHYHLEGAKPYSAIRKGDWKLIFLYEESHAELYNLRNDISERNNLAMTEKRKLAELMGDLRTWKKKIGAQLPVFNPNYNFEKEQNWIFSKSSTQK